LHKKIVAFKNVHYIPIKTLCECNDSQAHAQNEFYGEFSTNVSIFRHARM